MSAAETLYSVRIAYPDYLMRGRAQVVTLELYRDGELAPPDEDGSTFTLYDASGTVVTTGAVSVVDSIARYSLSAGDLPSTLALGHGYREEWVLTCADAVSRTYQRDAALVLHAAYPVVTDGDLVAVYSGLVDHLPADETTFQTKIDAAWKHILGALEARGAFPDYVVTSWSLRACHLDLTLALVCADFAARVGGVWSELAAMHRKEFELGFQRLTFVKGSGSDGKADSTDQTPAGRGVTYVNASPRGNWSGFGGL